MKPLKLPDNNLLLLSALCFILVSTFSLSISIPKVVVIDTPSAAEKFIDRPVLGVVDYYPVLSSQGVIAVDLDSGVTLYEKNADKQLLPASTTKIMTALVAREYFPLDLVIKVKGSYVEGQKMGLVAGEDITVENLLYGLLVYSANDAAEELARNFPGGKELFVQAMNLKAKQLHLENTHFENPVGFDGFTHVSTANDLILLAEMAVKDPLLAKIVSTKEIVIESADGRQIHRLENINELLGKVDGVVGVKTGWTANARENLVTLVERDNKRVILALLGSQDRFGETEELINWIFENYKWEEVIVAF